MLVKSGANARSGASVAMAMPCETAPVYADVRTKTRRPVVRAS